MTDFMLPQVIDCTVEDGRAVLRLFLPPELVYFQGHFPAGPLLAGVAQVHFAVLFARERLGLGGEFAGMEAVKYQRPMLPGQTVSLSLACAPDRNGFSFRYERDGELASSGRIRLR